MPRRAEKLGRGSAYEGVLGPEDAPLLILLFNRGLSSETAEHYQI
jgi:hypothetical protein